MDLDSPETWQWIWFVAAVALALGELAVPGTFFVLSFAIGAAFAAIASVLGASVGLSWIVFFVGTVVALGVLVPIGRRLTRHEAGGAVGATRWDNQRAVVLETIPAGPHATGMVRIEREEWRAESEGGVEVAAGTEVTVVRVAGTRVVVRARSPGSDRPPETSIDREGDQP